MRIAIVQCAAIADDAALACATIVRRLQWADAHAIDLVVFPEAFLLGHSYDPATIRSRAYAASASVLAELCRRIATFRATLVIGAFELAGGRIFNSAFVIEGGRIIDRYAKHHPNEPGVTAGSDFPIFARAGVHYGINICNDANHAEATEGVARQGADLILYPLNNMLRPKTADRWRERSLVNLITRARQSGCWIASSDVVGAAHGRISHGCSVIVAPDGNVLCRVPEGEEGVAVHDVLPQRRPADACPPAPPGAQRPEP